MHIGPYVLENQLILAPMAGITDRPFRDMCARFGAALTVSEMVASIPHLQKHKKTLLKTDSNGDQGIRSVQILGADPEQMAAAAQLNVARGAHIIDINMGCPAKKVCSSAAGSALMKDEVKVAQILSRVTLAVNVPVTLKIRTGWDIHQRNAVKIAKIAENCGIQAITIHGRTRACKFNGHAEYDTIKQVKQTVNIPIIANGDIDSPAKAIQVLQYTGADAVMIGRAAQGKPWIFKEMTAHFAGLQYHPPESADILAVMTDHLQQLYSFYGYKDGVRIARKHIGWYLQRLGNASADLKRKIYLTHKPEEQLGLLNSIFNTLIS